MTSRSRTYFSLWSGPCELKRMTFSVILSMVRSFIGGMRTSKGSMLTGPNAKTVFNVGKWTCYKEKLSQGLLYIED